MPNPRKKAAENIQKRKAEGSSRKYPGSLAMERSFGEDDLTAKGKKEWLGRKYPAKSHMGWTVDETNKEWYTKLAKSDPPDLPFSSLPPSPVDHWLRLQKGMHHNASIADIKKLISKGILKPSLLPSSKESKGVRKAATMSILKKRSYRRGKEPK